MTTINHEYYVSLEVAKLLRESGFNWECRKVYKTVMTEDLTLFTCTKEEGYRNTSEFICSAPTLDVAQRWLREVKNAHIEISYDKERMWNVTCIFDIDKTVTIDNYYYEKYFDSYEDAQEKGIKKALEMILEEGE